MSKRLEGQVTIVTGGAGGFGKAIAEKFVSEGAKVIITDMIEDVGKKSADDLKCEFVKANVTSREDWEKVVKFADEKYGAIHAVVNNAGTTYRNKVSQYECCDHLRLIQLAHQRCHRRRF